MPSQKKFPVSYINLYKNKNTYTLVTDYLDIMPERIVDTYKWQNCSYTLIN
jgi:hypothetical protein